MSREICGYDVFESIAKRLSLLSSAELIRRIWDTWDGLRPTIGPGRLHVYIDEAQLLHSRLPNCFESMRYEKRFRPMLSGVAHFFNQQLLTTTYLVFTG